MSFDVREKIKERRIGMGMWILDIWKKKIKIKKNGRCIKIEDVFRINGNKVSIKEVEEDSIW